MINISIIWNAEKMEAEESVDTLLLVIYKKKKAYKKVGQNMERTLEQKPLEQ